MMVRFAVTGLIFGFFTEWLLGNGRIYDNIIKKTTMRRLSTTPTMQTPRRKKMTVSNPAYNSSNRPKRRQAYNDGKGRVLCVLYDWGVWWLAVWPKMQRFIPKWV
jgi:hypothetical protein